MTNGDKRPLQAQQSEQTSRGISTIQRGAAYERFKAGQAAIQAALPKPKVYTPVLTTIEEKYTERVPKSYVRNGQVQRSWYKLSSKTQAKLLSRTRSKDLVSFERIRTVERPESAIITEQRAQVEEQAKEGLKAAEPVLLPKRVPFTPRKFREEFRLYGEEVKKGVSEFVAGFETQVARFAPLYGKPEYVAKAEAEAKVKIQEEISQLDSKISGYQERIKYYQNKIREKRKQGKDVSGYKESINKYEDKIDVLEDEKRVWEKGLKKEAPSMIKEYFTGYTEKYAEAKGRQEEAKQEYKAALKKYETKLESLSGLSPIDYAKARAKLPEILQRSLPTTKQYTKQFEEQQKVRDTELKKWEAANPGEKLVRDASGNVVGVESKLLGDKSFTYESYVKELDRLQKVAPIPVYKNIITGEVSSFKVTPSDKLWQKGYSTPQGKFLETQEEINRYIKENKIPIAPSGKIKTAEEFKSFIEGDYYKYKAFRPEPQQSLLSKAVSFFGKEIPISNIALKVPVDKAGNIIKPEKYGVLSVEESAKIAKWVPVREITGKTKITISEFHELSGTKTPLSFIPSSPAGIALTGISFGYLSKGFTGIAKATGILFRKPITTGVTKGIDILIPKSETGFAPRGILPQVGRGALFAASAFVPGVGAAYISSLVESAAKDPSGTVSSLVDYAKKNPYEIATIATSGGVIKEVLRVRNLKKTYNEIDSTLVKRFGEDSKVVKDFRAARRLAYGKEQLPKRVATIAGRPWTSEKLKAVVKEPELVKIVDSVISKYKPTIIGSSTLLPYLNLKNLRRGLLGDIDVQDVQGLLNSQSKAMAQELYVRLKKAGYDVKYDEGSFAGYQKYHVTYKGMELLNAGTSVEYFFKTQLGPIRGLFETKVLGQTIKEPISGAVLGTLRGQLRIKLFSYTKIDLSKIDKLEQLFKQGGKELIEKEIGGRAKDLLDVMDIVDGTRNLYDKSGKFIGETIPYGVRDAMRELREMLREETIGRAFRARDSFVIYKNKILRNLSILKSYIVNKISSLKKSQLFLSKKGQVPVSQIRERFTDFTSLTRRAISPAKEKIEPIEKISYSLAGRSLPRTIIPERAEPTYAKPKPRFSLYAVPTYAKPKITYAKPKVPIRERYLLKKPTPSKYPVPKPSPYRIPTSLYSVRPYPVKPSPYPVIKSQITVTPYPIKDIRPPIIIREPQIRRPKEQISKQKIKREPRKLRGFTLTPTIAGVVYKYKRKKPLLLSKVTGFEILRK
jgi:hypothetical protein